MDLVLQRQRNDCGIAVLAMVAVLPYEAAAHELRNDYRPDEGVSETALYLALARLGFAVQPVHRHPALWPPRPFAPVHFATCSLPLGLHYVVIDAHGRVLDPHGNPDHHPLIYSQWTGVWRTSAWPTTGVRGLNGQRIW